MRLTKRQRRKLALEVLKMTGQVICGVVMFYAIYILCMLACGG